MKRQHSLKTWPEPFQAVIDGIKRFEIREDDRGFAVGDDLILREFDPHAYESTFEQRYTGREVTVRVTYMAHGRFGLPLGLCVMGIDPVKP